MKKILSFFAFVAIVLTFAACGGNEPEIKDFTFRIKTLSYKAKVQVTPSKKDTYFFSNYELASEIEKKGGLEQYIGKEWLNHTFDYLVSLNAIGKDFDEYEENMDPDKEFIAYAFYVEKLENGYPKIVGDIAFKEFKTLPMYYLNGLFSVSATKKVYFSTSNLMKKDGEFEFCEDYQYACYGRASGTQFDLHEWSRAYTFRTTVPTADEWWYLFRLRPNAEKLFAHACINGTNGVLLLPDNWQTPDGIDLTPSVEMGMEWKDGTYSHQNNNFNGYEKNKYNTAQWETLEFAGAVFLPAAGGAEVQVEYVNKGGCYWSSTGAGGEASYLVFRPDALLPTHLYSADIYNSIRPVREVAE